MTRAIVVSVVLVAALGIGARSASAQVRVPGFTPSENGFQFSNAWWPVEPDVVVNVAGTQVPLGNAQQGLCGGMVYAVRDYFQSTMHVPIATHNPAPQTTLYNYIVERLFDGFTADVVARTYLLQSELWDYDRQSTMVGQWPLIKADLDAGILSPLMLIRLRSDLNPSDLGHNHQVLAWGYDVLSASSVAIYIYDPNDPANDAVTVTVDLAHATARQSTGEAVTSFFRTDYAPKAPPATTSWRNGFEGADASAWWFTGVAGMGYDARTGTNAGWVKATGTGTWNAVNTWAPLLSGRTCDMRSYVLANETGPIDAYMSMRSSVDGHILNEVQITEAGSSYERRTVEFTADSNWGLFYVGMWGVGPTTWIWTDDVEVVCEAW
jgi:hypothetical protein